MSEVWENSELTMSAFTDFHIKWLQRKSCKRDTKNFRGCQQRLKEIKWKNLEKLVQPNATQIQQTFFLVKSKWTFAYCQKQISWWQNKWEKCRINVTVSFNIFLSTTEILQWPIAQIYNTPFLPFLLTGSTKIVFLKSSYVKLCNSCQKECKSITYFKAKGENSTSLISVQMSLNLKRGG